MIGTGNQFGAQISKIASRLESTHDGEALVAARMLTKRLADRGFSLSEIVERGVSLNAGPVTSLSMAAPARQRPFPEHWVKVDAILDHEGFVRTNLSPRSIHRLQCLRNAPCIDSSTAAWIDGLLDRAQTFRPQGGSYGSRS